MRLDKFLADAGIGTRSQVKKLIKDKRVSVNGEPAKDAGLILTETDLVELDGEAVGYEEFEYYMLNKPQGLISQSRKNSLKRGEKFIGDDEDSDAGSVVDLIVESGKIDLFPAGRLDKDTEGFLLITNDGQLAHRLLSPKHHVEKTYYAELDGELTEEAVRKLEKGVNIGDPKPTLPAKVNWPVEGREDCAQIVITEGRYHQVKRMFEAVGLHVTYLKRTSFGPLTLDPNLAPGDYRRLTEEEIEKLKTPL